MGSNVAPSNDELKADVDAYIAAGGNKSEAARMRGLHRHTYRDRLDMAQVRLGLQLGKVIDGRVDQVEAQIYPLPKKGKVARYICSSMQNNTHPHPSFQNLLAYGAWTKKAKRGDTFEMIVGTFSYSIDAYGAKAVKRGAYKPQGKLWYDKALIPYIKDESIQLAPGLVWCGEQNILPTAALPLNGLEDYNGRNSNIVPHVKQHMYSVGSLADEATKFNYSTGAITQRNYIQKRAGIVADRKHTYGALMVEVDSGGNWFVRQLVIDAAGVVYDIGPSGYRGVRVENGKVHAIKANAPASQSFVEAIQWGDIHAAEMDLSCRNLGWATGGFIDQIAPRKQFCHDIFSMRSRGHHEIKDFFRTYAKFINDEGGVQDEVKVTADFMSEAWRSWCETIVVRSNHDRHLDRWLNEAKSELDPQNARYWAMLRERRLAAYDDHENDFNVLEYALRNVEGGIPASIRFLGEDESYVLCKTAPGGGIEMGLHGDLGINGARGSTRGLRKLGRKVTKDHDHTACIIDGVVSGGACSLNFPYMKGPNSHSVSHVVVFENAARQIVTFWNGKARA